MKGWRVRSGSLSDPELWVNGVYLRFIYAGNESQVLCGLIY